MKPSLDLSQMLLSKSGKNYKNTLLALNSKQPDPVHIYESGHTGKMTQAIKYQKPLDYIMITWCIKDVEFQRQQSVSKYIQAKYG